MDGNLETWCFNWTNCSEPGDPEPNLWCLLLVFLPVCCISGNCLVVMAVLTEKTLKTTTNFLLVSLAAADLLIGSLVMPFAIYLTVNNLRWYLPPVLCNFFCVVDVSASTSSIVHLVVISIDRFFAVVKQFEYKTVKHQRRVYMAIIFAWVFSIAIGFPLGIGLNQGQGDTGDYECGITNTLFMFSCSILAFYIPSLVMLIMYGFVFYQLRGRMRAVKLQEMAAGEMVKFGDNIGNILENVYGKEREVQHNNTMAMWAMPFLRTIEATIDEEDGSMSSDEIEELTTILHTLESDQRIHKLPENLSNPQCPVPKRTKLRKRQQMERHHYGALRNVGETPECDVYSEQKRYSPVSVGKHRTNRLRRFSQDVRKTFARRRSIYRAKAKIVGLKSRALTLLMKLKSKQGMAIRKEARATKLVSVVMVTFLLCWLPFFTMNIIKVIKIWNGTWDTNLERIFIFFTWLGYLNSCLNPFIYSAINRKFRAAFRNILHCPGPQKRRKTVRGSQAPARHFRSTRMPLTTSFATGHPITSLMPGLKTAAGSSDQGYVSTSNFLQEVGPLSLVLLSPSTSPRKRRGQYSPCLWLAHSPSTISEHDTPACSSITSPPEKTDRSRSSEAPSVDIEVQVETSTTQVPEEHDACEKLYCWEDNGEEHKSQHLSPKRKGSGLENGAHRKGGHTAICPLLQSTNQSKETSTLKLEAISPTADNNCSQKPTPIEEVTKFESILTIDRSEIENYELENPTGAKCNNNKEIDIIVTSFSHQEDPDTSVGELEPMLPVMTGCSYSRSFSEEDTVL